MVANSISYNDNHYTKCTFLSIDKFGLFVYWHMNLWGLFNAKAIPVEEHKLYYLTHSWRDKGFMPFPKVLIKE